MMDPNLVRGLTNKLLYDIDRVPDLADAAMVDRLADAIINRRNLKDGVEAYAAAVGAVLSAGQLPPGSIDFTRRFSEAEILDFLGRLHRKLDSMRPWPRPRYVKLDVDRWPTFANARGIARLNVPQHQIEGLLNSGFDAVDAGTAKLPVLILEMGTGETVALMGSTDTRSTVWTLLQRDPADTATVLAHFRDQTGFTDDQLVPLA
jgi:hypothetical protein